MGADALAVPPGTAAPAPLLAVEGLRTHFFTKAGVVKAVDDVSFTLAAGEVLGLVGESGSGKSMTGYSLMGLIDPPGRIVEGSIRLKGQELTTLPAERMRGVSSVVWSSGGNATTVPVVSVRPYICTKPHLNTSMHSTRSACGMGLAP